MHFAEKPHVLGFERASALLQVQIGCTWGRCAFCAVCARHPGVCEVTPIEEVAADLDELAAGWRAPARVFLYGGNPFGIDGAALDARLALIRAKLPSVRSIGGFACVADIKRRSDDELLAWAAAGVDGLSVGAESAWGPALKQMHKAQTPEDILQQCRRLERAGISYTLFYLAGMGGAGHGAEAARASAEVFNQLRPRRINIMSLTVFEGTPLHEMVQRGQFTPAPEREIFAEMRDFIAGLTDVETLIETGHDVNFVNFDGLLPRDREGMCALLDMRAKGANEQLLSDYRSRIRPF